MTLTSTPQRGVILLADDPTTTIVEDGETKEWFDTKVSPTSIMDLMVKHDLRSPNDSSTSRPGDPVAKLLDTIWMEHETPGLSIPILLEQTGNLSTITKATTTTTAADPNDVKRKRSC